MLRTMGLLFAATGFNFAGEPGDQIVVRYLSAVQSRSVQEETMRVDIEASLPKLQKHGRMRLVTYISAVGQVVYRKARFEGDSVIKREVIARYLAQEQQGPTRDQTLLAVSPANYRFEYRGTADYAGRQAHVFRLTPLHKRLGLFAGELWVDAQTYLPLREWGQFVKRPSILVKDVYFVRDFIIAGTQSVPRRLILAVDTALFGKAELTAWFDRVPVSGKESWQAAGYDLQTGDASQSCQ